MKTKEENCFLCGEKMILKEEEENVWKGKCEKEGCGLEFKQTIKKEAPGSSLSFKFGPKKKEEDMEENKTTEKKYEINLEWMNLLVFVLILIILFTGEPDIHDAIIKWLMG